MSALSRREALRAFGLLAGGVAFNAACTRRVRPYVIDPPARSSRLRHFTPVNVAPDRVIRTVVGLRPFRPSGFVVRAEPLGDKLLVHNYGHGGGGVTLSWGTAYLAAELVRESGKTGSAAAVIGCGVIGLSTARTLQRRGFEVTIYTKDMPPETTSNIAGASWSPTAVIDEANRTPAWDSQFERAARYAHRSFQLLAGDEYAVRWREQYSLSAVDYPENWDHEMLHDLFPASRKLTPSENPFPAKYVRVINTMFIEPSIYLNTLLRDFYIAGGRIRRVMFESPGELATLPEPVVMNCTGLGAREIFGDRELMPVKGQLTALLPQPEVEYAMVSMGLYMFPRRDGIMLGGTFERGVETLEVNREAEQLIIAGHKRIFEGMR